MDRTSSRTSVLPSRKSPAGFRISTDSAALSPLRTLPRTSGSDSCGPSTLGVGRRRS